MAGRLWWLCEKREDTVRGSSAMVEAASDRGTSREALAILGQAGVLAGLVQFAGVDENNGAGTTLNDLEAAGAPENPDNLEPPDAGVDRIDVPVPGRSSPGSTTTV
jgi:hypothetical protein